MPPNLDAHLQVVTMSIPKTSVLFPSLVNFRHQQALLAIFYTTVDYISVKCSMVFAFQTLPSHKIYISTLATLTDQNDTKL
jgi:hypothetical protein